MVATFKEIPSPFFYFNRQEFPQPGSDASGYFTLGTLRFDQEESGRCACAFQHTRDDGFLSAAANVR